MGQKYPVPQKRKSNWEKEKCLPKPVVPRGFLVDPKPVEHFIQLKSLVFAEALLTSSSFASDLQSNFKNPPVNFKTFPMRLVAVFAAADCDLHDPRHHAARRMRRM